MKALKLTWSLLVAGVLASSLVLGGCAGKLQRSTKTDENALIIPDFPTAKEQFNFAQVYAGSMLISPELPRRREQMAKIAETYQRVITNFPNDPTYVPLTTLELGDCAARSSEDALAIQLYQQAYGQAGTNDFVKSRAEYSIARVYDNQLRHEEAKAIYKRIIDIYGKSPSGRVQDVVRRSATEYYRVYDTSKEGATQQGQGQKR